MNPQPPPHPDENNVFGQLLLFLFLAVAIVVILQLTVRTEPPPPTPGPPAKAPQESPETPETPPATTQPESPPPPPDPFKAEVSIENLDDTQIGWLTILGQTTSDLRSTAVGRYTEHNEFTIETSNVNRLVLELDRLPVLNNQRFILHIDGQNMVLYPPQSGVVSFARSAEGTWIKED